LGRTAFGRTPRDQGPIAALVARWSYMWMRRHTLAASILVAACCSPFTSLAGEPPQEVSLVALLANPQAYEGRVVRVEGFFDGTHHESCRLFLSREDFDQNIARNSIYVGWPGCLDRDRAAKVQARYALVEGIFEADIGAGFGSYSEISEVRRLEVIKSRAEFERSSRAPWWLASWPWLPLGILFVAGTTTAAYLIAKRFTVAELPQSPLTIHP
jgi:hypothetical protein